MAFDTPQSTNEAILQNMLGASNALKPPQSRVEKLLQELSGQMPEANPSEGTTTGTLERLKIGDDIYSVEGGGSGTSDYDALNNKPQIAGTTLSGNKSLADLGIASASAVSDILNGTDIDSFGDVETALAGKQGTLTFDSAPTSESTNPVTSGGVYTALAGKVDKTSVGVASGVAELDSNGKVPSAQLPSYVDDVVNGYLHDGKFYADDQYTTEITGEEGKIYVDLATNKTYRWSGLAFVEISESLALGETSSTAYAGDKGKANADAISAIKDGQTIDSFADVESALAGKQDTLTFDNTPTENSTNPVKSGGIYSALAGKADTGIVADDFDSTASYVIGNYCIENGKLYRFKANHSGTWSSADVDEIQITGELATLKSGLTNLDTEVNGDATVYPYADVITIPDAVPANVADCSVKIEPMQDLHGYDKPWPAGGGKNKLPLVLADIKSINTAGTWNGNIYTYRSTTVEVLTDNADNVLGFKVNGTPTGGRLWFRLVPNTFDIESNTILNGCPSGGWYNTYCITILDSGDTETLYSDTGSSGATINNAVENANVYIRIEEGYTASNLMFYPMIRLSTETDATFAPYSNECPITGHTEASVQRDGKNHFDKNNINSFTGYIDTNRQEYISNIQYKSCYIKCKPNTAYTISKVAGKTFRVASSIDAPENGVPFINTEADHTGTNITITTGSNARYLTVLYWSSANGDTLTPAEIEQTIQIELGSSATDYEPYAGKTYTIQLGDTIYGGEVDFDSGVMTVDREYLYVDGSDTSILTTIAGQLQIAISSASKTNTDIYHPVGDLVCNYLEEIYSNSTAANGIYYRANGSHNLIVRGNDYTPETTLADWVTWLGNNPLQIVYGLATPTTIQLTPQQIQLLKGTNTLTASTGQISVTVNGVSGSIGAVQEQVNDTDAALAELSSNINALLSPTAATNVTIVNGGYAIVGRMVLLNFSFTTSDAIGLNTSIASLPVEAINNTHIDVYKVSDNTMVNKCRMYNGNLVAGVQLDSGATYIVSGVYVKSAS